MVSADVLRTYTCNASGCIVLYVIREGILHQQPDDISFRLPEDVPLEFPEDVPMECLVIFPGNVM